MEQVKPFIETVDVKDKKKIWDLYFNDFYSFEQLLRLYDKKYTHSQLRTIIMKGIDEYGKTKQIIK